MIARPRCRLGARVGPDWVTGEEGAQRRRGAGLGIGTDEGSDRARNGKGPPVRVSLRRRQLCQRAINLGPQVEPVKRPGPSFQELWRQS